MGKIDKWQKASKSKNKRQEKKARIREAFSNVPQVEVIPAKSKESENQSLCLRVAAYCRVSTYEEAQAGSYELQIQYYRELISNNDQWILAGIYSDEGASGNVCGISDRTLEENPYK